MVLNTPWRWYDGRVRFTSRIIVCDAWATLNATVADHPISLTIVNLTLKGGCLVPVVGIAMSQGVVVVPVPDTDVVNSAWEVGIRSR